MRISRERSQSHLTPQKTKKRRNKHKISKKKKVTSRA